MSTGWCPHRVWGRKYIFGRWADYIIGRGFVAGGFDGGVIDDMTSYCGACSIDDDALYDAP